MKIRIFPLYLTLIIFFFLNSYNLVKNYDYENSPITLTESDINITDITFEDITQNKTIIVLNETELKSNIFVAYIRLFFNLSYCDEFSLKLKLHNDSESIKPVEIYFYLTNDTDAIINNTTLNYKKGVDSLSIRTYDLSLYDLSFYYIKFVRNESESTDNIIEFTFANTYNDITADANNETSDDEKSDDQSDEPSDGEKSDEPSDGEKSDEPSDGEKSDEPSDDEKSDDKSDEPSDDEKSDDQSDEPSEEEKSDDQSDEPSEEEKSDDQSDEPSEEEEREEEIEYKAYEYELKFNFTKNYEDKYMLPDEFKNKTNKSIFYYYKRDKEILDKKKIIILTVLSSGLNNFKFEYDYYSSDNTKIDHKTLETKQFFNGYSLIINNKLFGEDDKDEKFIKFQFTLNDNTETITIKTRKYSENVQIKAGESYDILLEEDNIKKQCFTFEKEDKKYILNFLSLTKNIKADILNYKTIPINKESMTDIIDVNKYNQICFTFEKTTIYDFGSLTFEVMESRNDSDTVIYNHFPVIRGLWTHHILLANTATFYKPEIYLEGLKVKVNFHMTKGYLELYDANCTDEKHNLQNLSKYNDINGFISIKQNRKSDNYSPLVYCTNDNDNDNDNTCEFDIEIKNVEEPSYLYQNLKVYSFNFENDEETYKINTKELKVERKNIMININSFYDEPNILITDNEGETINIKPLYYYLMDNKLYYQIPYDKYENTDYLNVRIGKIDGNTKYYYGINYQLKTENEISTYSLENSILYYYQIKDKNLNFDFINKDKDFPYSYILSVNSFGNKMALKINENDIIPFNNYIQAELNNTFTFEILSEDNSLKLFNLEYHELSKHNKIFIENGHLYKNRLNKTNNEIIYTYLIYNVKNDSKIVINFRKYSNISVNIEYDNNKLDSFEINELSKLIILNETNNICNKYINDHCEFTVKIKKEKDKLNEDIEFSIQITEYKNDDSTLIYLPQNTFMGNNILIPKYNIQYFMEIEKGKEGKIYVDFLEGEGLTSATLNDINGENVTLNYSNKYFDIKSEDTTKCKEDLCKISIIIFLDNNKPYKSWYKYNIYSKINLNNEDTFNFYVPELEYIYGYLEKEKDEHSYVTKITKTTKKVAFHINCDDCQLDISYDGHSNNTNILFKDEFILEPKDSNYDFNGKEIRYTIKNNNLVSNQRYIIKVIPFESYGQLNIPINSIKNEFCKIRGGLPCYFLIKKEYYNKIDKISLLTPNHDKAKIYIEEFSYKEKYNEIDCKNNVEDEKLYNIKVELDYDDMITFVTSQYDLLSDPKNYTYPEDYTIKELEEGKKINISLLEPNGFLHYDINLIKGNGTVKSFLNNEKYVLESGFKDNLNLLFESESESELHSDIEIGAGSKNFIFYYRIIKNNHNNNLAELNFQKTNYFKYLNNADDSKWPLHFYMKLNITKNDKSDLKDINFNYKFLNTYENYSFAPSDESYITTFSLVDEKYIAELKNKSYINENDNDINCTSEYREDITAGYSLIKADLIKEKIQEDGNYYLLISINYTHNFSQNYDNQDINAALTVFDYNKDYILPMNEYLLLLINQKRDISISKTYENDKNPFIESALQNISLNLIPKVDNIPSYGKTFYKLQKDQKYTLSLEEKNSNLLIKYGLSEYSNYSYFNVNNENITYNETDKTMSFEKITKKGNNDKLYNIYTIKIYQVDDNYSFIPRNVYENTKCYDTIKKIDNSNNNKISYDIGFIDYGYYYLSVLAEGRKGNVYEYLLYEPLFIKNISNLTEANITISYNDFDNSYTPNYTRSVKFTANLVNGAKDEDYIKLSVKHKSYDDDNFIYVSTDEKLYNSDELYKDSEYKVINRNTSLIIPVKEVKDKLLYIRIPCKKLCDYTFYYQIYKKDEILINDNECFDIKNINDNRVSFKYNIDNDNNMKSSLFTMTSYSINDLSSFESKINDTVLQKTYFNGYSYLYEPNKINNSELKFIIDFKSRINVCHRFLNNNKTIFKKNDTYIDIQKIIFDGDIKYSRIQNGKKDCFLIDKNHKNMDVTDYKINFISKTKNIKINVYSKNETEILPDIEEQFVNEESFNYTFKSNYDEFCISKSDDKSNKDEDTSVMFQLLSITKTNYINQTLYMPLIKGISTKQHLKRGGILYYRINENTKNSESINVNFQTISGNPKVYHSKATNYPYYNISDIKDLGNEITGFHNNIKYSIKIDKEEEDIYQKPSFPVIVVYCPIKEEDNDDCNYYIEMSNDLETILLNKNRKIYSYIDNSNGTNNIDQYKVDLSLYDIDDSSNIYIQLYSFTGEPKLEIIGLELTDYPKNYYTYNDNGMIFNFSLKNHNNLQFNIKISEKNQKNTNYSLFYYITNNVKNDFYLPSGEVHYNILPKNEINNYYYFQDYLKTTNISYIVSINSINCDLNINNFEKKRSYQFEINTHEKVKVKIPSDSLNIKCEFTISAIEKSNDIYKPNELIVNDRTYQFVKFSNNFNSLNLHYLMTEDDLKDNKNVYIYTSKKTMNQLKINYNIKHDKSIIYNHNEMIELKNINKEELSKQFNLYILIITIEPNESINNFNNFEFKIKVNGNKNKYSSYLDEEEIESDIIIKGKQNKYYYEYYSDGQDINIIGQIYLDCKGVAQLAENSDSDIVLTEKANYINIKNDPECVDGCKIYFSVLLSNDEENNEMNVYNIYLVSKYKRLNVYQNVNIYGKQYPNMNLFFTTEIDLDKNGKEVLFNLNCLKCTVKLKANSKEYIIEKSQIIKLVESNGILTYEIINKDNKIKDNEYYYYFSILDTKSPKFIYQKEAIIFKNNGKFILPIYSYFSFTQKSILFYVPETEQVDIYAKIIKMENYTFDNFDLIDDNDKNSTILPITNRLYINLEDYIGKDVYILIEVNSKLNNPFTFIVSKFNQLLIEDDKKVLYPKNLYIIGNDINNYMTFNNNDFKIRMNLISGSGYFSLINNNKNEIYNLNYQNQEIISLPNKNRDISKINIYNSLTDEDFIFYLDTENNNDVYDLIVQKTNYIKYLNTKYEIFTINLNIENINNNDNLKNSKDLFINYHFSYLEGKNNSELIYSLYEKFIAKIIGIKDSVETIIKEDNKNVIIKYYEDYRRGYIYIDSSYIKAKNFDSFKLIIKGGTNYTHKNVYLEVTPLYIYTKGNEPIEFPRNTYIEYISKNQTIIFSKPNQDYNILKVEYANKVNLSLNIFSETKKNGKYSFNYSNDSLKYYMRIEKEINRFLLKYTIKKENQTEFYINNNNNTLTCQKIDKNNNNTYSITFNNIKIDNKNITNYNISYLIRLYNYLDYLEDFEINNIYTNTTLLISHRKQLNESEKNSDKITYVLECGKDLDFGDYIISVLGEVFYNDNVEYFSYDLFRYSIVKEKETEFDEYWIAPLIFVIVVFIIISIFIIKHCIDTRKENKKNPSEGTLLTNKISI